MECQQSFRAYTSTLVNVRRHWGCTLSLTVLRTQFLVVYWWLTCRQPERKSSLESTVTLLGAWSCPFLRAVASLIVPTELISSQVGLAVGDTETMKKFATVKRLAMQIEYQIEIEEAFPSFLTRAVYETVYVEKPNKSSKYHRYGVNSNFCCNQSLNLLISRRIA